MPCDPGSVVRLDVAESAAAIQIQNACRIMTVDGRKRQLPI